MVGKGAVKGRGREREKTMKAGHFVGENSCREKGKLRGISGGKGMKDGDF